MLGKDICSSNRCLLVRTLCLAIVCAVDAFTSVGLASVASVGTKHHFRLHDVKQRDYPQLFAQEEFKESSPSKFNRRSSLSLAIIGLLTLPNIRVMPVEAEKTGKFLYGQEHNE